MAQHLRRSQFVITYGPGAIIESTRGPRVIPLANIGLFRPRSSLRPDSFEVSDRRMSRGLLNGARIFRLPSNAELGLDQETAVYDTKAFPSWRLCQNFQAHNGTSVLYRGYRCPVCDSGTRQEAIRFIRACPAGHMDDVDWPYLVHRGRSGCNQSRWFRWSGEGASLSRVRIECTRCGSDVNLGWAYGQPWPCSGRFPERELVTTAPMRPGCSSNSRIIQRQASNLRISELKALFSISNRYVPTRLHNLLQLAPIYYTLAATGAPSSLQQLQTLLNNLVTQGLMSQTEVGEILGYDWQELNRTIADVLSVSQTQVTYTDLLIEELLGLVDASTKGAPPVRGPIPSSPVIFEVRPQDVKRSPGPNGAILRITPVARLRTVIVQVGYRRAVGQISAGVPQTTLVPTSMRDPISPDQQWYPGVEFYGEGIFIMLDANDGWHFSLKGESWKHWLKAYENPNVYDEVNYAFRIPGRFDELHPVFVWWHTLSHLLIRAISIEAGYPSPSIRERVYFQSNGRQVRGGIILYATQPGSEGTMGGMISLAPHFRQILNTAFDMLETCSSDPLCSENKFHLGRYCGASCYACTLLSETSCEHRNLWLDRNVLLENLP